MVNTQIEKERRQKTRKRETSWRKRLHTARMNREMIRVFLIKNEIPLLEKQEIIFAETQSFYDVHTALTKGEDVALFNNEKYYRGCIITKKIEKKKSKKALNGLVWKISPKVLRRDKNFKINLRNQLVEKIKTSHHWINNPKTHYFFREIITTFKKLGYEESFIDRSIRNDFIREIYNKNKNNLHTLKTEINLYRKRLLETKLNGIVCYEW